MKRRPDTVTPSFWIGEPPKMLPKGQADLPLVLAPREDPALARLRQTGRTAPEREAVARAVAGLASPLRASGLRAYCGEACRAYTRQRAYRQRATGSAHYIPHGADYRHAGGPIRRSAARCLATIRNFRHGRAICGECVGCGKPMPAPHVPAQVLRACRECGKANGTLGRYGGFHGLSAYYAHAECWQRAEERAAFELLRDGGRP